MHIQLSLLERQKTCEYCGKRNMEGPEVRRSNAVMRLERTSIQVIKVRRLVKWDGASNSKSCAPNTK